jgi:hypothetical protein
LRMKTEPRLLISGRFEVISYPSRIAVYDIQKPKKDNAGFAAPVEVIPIDCPKSVREIGMMALGRLLDHDHIKLREYLHFATNFYADYPVQRDGYSGSVKESPLTSRKNTATGGAASGD